jgi:hypothetical protein
MVQYSAVLVWYGTRYQVPAAAGTLQYQYRTVLYCSITIDYYLLEPVSIATSSPLLPASTARIMIVTYACHFQQTGNNGL